MITNDEELVFVRAQMQRAEEALASLRQRIPVRNSRNFALYSEGYVEQIFKLRAEIDAYLGVPAPAQPDYQPAPLEAVEKQHILNTLQFTGWDESQAASILQIERSTLDRKIKGYNLQR